MNLRSIYIGVGRGGGSSSWTAPVLSGMTVNNYSDVQQNLSITVTGNIGDGISWEYSLNGSTNWTVKGTSALSSYSATGLTINTLYYWRCRAYKGTAYSSYSDIVSATTTLDLLLTKTGTGAGVTTLQIAASENVVITLGANAKFYSNSGGTLDESATYTVTSGATRTIYLKCTTGTAIMNFDKNRIIRIPAWTSSTNAASISGNIGAFINLTYLYIGGNNTIPGDVTLLTTLTYFAVQSGNTLSGSISGMINCTYVSIQGTGNTLSGDVSQLKSTVTTIEIQGLNTVTGSVAAKTSLTRLYVTGSNTISGSVVGLTSLNYLYVTGSNTLSGSVAGLTSLTRLWVTGNNTLSGSVAALTSLTNLTVSKGNTLSGSVAALTSLTWLEVDGAKIAGEVNTLEGSIAALTLLTHVNVGGNNTISGSVAGLTNITGWLRIYGSNTVSGSVQNITGCIYLSIYGSNTVSGSIAGMTNLVLCDMDGNNTITIPNVTNLTKLYAIYGAVLGTLSSANVNQILADFWANKDVPKMAATSQYGRYIDLRSMGSEAPTGQGIIDKANLQAYASPTGSVLWTVLTN
jgi:hypothetical protein